MGLDDRYICQNCAALVGNVYSDDPPAGVPLTEYRQTLARSIVPGRCPVCGMAGVVITLEVAIALAFKMVKDLHNTIHEDLLPAIHQIDVNADREVERAADCFDVYKNALDRIEVALEAMKPVDVAERMDADKQPGEEPTTDGG